MASSKSQVVTLRLSNETIARIERRLKLNVNPYMSVGEYVRHVVDYWVTRHDGDVRCKRKRCDLKIEEIHR